MIRFLGMWFDTKLTWQKHIDKIIDKCKKKKVLNVMRSVGSREWGADKKTMKMIYIGLIRSTLDYGCIAYGSASKIHLDKIEIIQGAALRICCRACKIIPIPVLQVEMGELPIDSRRLLISLVY